MNIYSYNYVGKQYHDFFAKNLPKWKYIKGLDGYNLSMVKINNNEELYCVRFTATYEALSNRKVIPGSFSNLKDIPESFKEVIKKFPPRNYGKAFYWENWINKMESSIFFVGSFDGKRININTKYKPYSLVNKRSMPTFIKDAEGKKAHGLLAEDYRLINFKDKILFYDSRSTFIEEIKLENNKIKFIDFNKKDFYFNHWICDKPENNKSLYDNIFYHENVNKNWSFFNFLENKNNFNKSKFEFLHWFIGNKIVGVQVPITRRKYCKEFNLIHMKKDIIEGMPKSNSKSPIFSFGTPFVSVSKSNIKDKNILYDKIGVGHIKLRRNKNETDKDGNLLFNKNFEKIIDNIENYLISKYKDKYIQHYTYIYMMYFIRIICFKENNKINYKILFSDSYLPVNNKYHHKNKYKFSLVFPVGIINKKINNENLICVSAGEGDFYTVIYTFKEKDVLDSCKHDISNFNFKKYKYEILEK